MYNETEAREILAAHTQQIRTLFENQKTIEHLARSTEELAQCVVRLTERMKSVDTRLSAIEQEKRSRVKTIWASAVSAAVSAAVAYLAAAIL